MNVSEKNIWKVQQRSRSGLFLMELIVIILFFAAASGICMQLFAKAHLLSTKSLEENRAMVCAQSAAEQFKAAAAQGDPALPQLGKQSGWQYSEDKKQWLAGYDASWQPADISNAVYLLSLSPSRENDLFSAMITVSHLNNQDHAFICQLTVKKYAAPSKP